MTVLRRNSPRLDKIVEALSTSFGSEYYCIWNNYNHYPFSTQQSGYFFAYKKVLSSKKSLLCAETPLIGRHLFDKDDPNCYYRVAFEFVSTFDTKNFRLEGFEPDESRLVSMLSSLEITCSPWRKSGSHILYAMQVPADTSLRGLDVFAAAQYDLLQIRLVSDRPIFITLHPKIFEEAWARDKFEKNKENLLGFLEVAKLVGANLDHGQSSKSLLKDCWCVVCHSSGFGIESILAGVPVITLSNGSFVRGITSHSLNDIESPWTGDIWPELSRLAYCQWTLDEIKNGKTYEHLLRN